MDRAVTKVIEPQAAVAGVQGARRAASRELSHARSMRSSGTSCSSAPMDGDSAVTMLEDLADLFEQAAADGTPIREIVGDDPVDSSRRSSRTTPKGGGSSPGAGTADQRHRARRGRRHGRLRGSDDHDDGPGAARARSGEVLRGAARAPRRGLRRSAGQHLRPARLQRRRQDHGREDPVHAAQARRGDGHRQWLRHRHPTGGRAGVHQPHRTVRRRGRDPHRAREPGPDSPAAAPEGRWPDRG